MSCAIIKFFGTITNGIGRFKEMTIPGRVSLPGAPINWPIDLVPGSLNIQVDENGYPAELLSRCAGDHVQKLDSGVWQPMFVIPGGKIVNNMLTPIPAMPKRGDAQVWLCDLHRLDDGRSVQCWLMRRFGSGLTRQLELVSDHKLRDVLQLIDGERVAIKVEGTWK